MEGIAARVLEWASNTNIVAYLFSLSRLPDRGAMSRLFAEKLRYIRRQREVTQAQLAEQLTLASHAHIANLEAGRDVPSLELIVRIARLLNVSTDYLLRDTLPVEDSAVPAPILPFDSEAPSFGSQLRTLRLKHQLSQRALARHLGLASRAYIGALEANRGKLPSPELVVRIADFFGVTTDDLLRAVIPPSAISADPRNE